MVTCDCLFQSRDFKCTATSPGTSRRLSTSDQLWQSIRREAFNEVEDESVLRPWVDQVILQRHSLGDALAKSISLKLADSLIGEDSLYAQLAPIACEDLGIEESATRDLRAIEEDDPATASHLHPLLHFKGFLSLQAYRFAHHMWHRQRRSLAFFLQSRASEVFGVDIHPAARIGDGVFIDHATGVVIGETSTVGDDVTILHGVTLGGTGKESGDRHPKIGNGVLIGASVQVLGNLHIGDHSRIGAGSVVLHDVPAHSTVAGVPARVVQRRDHSMRIHEAATA